MCNLSQGIFIKGFIEGFKETFPRGSMEERAVDILATYKAYREIGLSDSEAAQQVMEYFSLTEQEARTYMAKKTKTI